MLNRSKAKGLLPQLALALALWIKQEQILAGPYRPLRSFKDPAGDPGATRGLALCNAGGELFYMDLLGHSASSRESLIGPLGFKKLKALPPEGRGNKANPNEWADLQGMFDGEAPKDVEEDLRALYRCRSLGTAPGLAAELV
jgi:hypothetical protein